MKPLLPLMALMLLLPSLPAQAAGARDHPLNLLVVDRDLRGTNVRDAPSGNIIRVLPLRRGTLRFVAAHEEVDGWFRVDAMGTRGWMHGSVLGLCAEPTEDGDPVLSKAPTYDSPIVRRIPAGALVQPLSMRNDWLKVRYQDGRAQRDGWLPEQSLTMSEGEWDYCARAWMRRR